MDEFPVPNAAASDEILGEEEYEKLYSAPAEIVALLSVFYGGISIIAIVGNTLVIWVVATTRQMRTVTNMYIANLAFADVIIGMFCIPFQFQAALLQRWTLPDFMCAFCPFVQAVSVNVSVFTLTAIAIDRHRAIINPLRARPTKFISKIIIATIWVTAIAFAVPCAIAFRVETLNERIRENDVILNVSREFCSNINLTDDQLQSYRYSLVFVQYLVPFCVISFVYIQMAVKLWGTHAPGNAQDSRDITLLRNKKKVIKMLIIVVVVFGMCWLPLQSYNILYVTIPEINEYHFINIIWFCCDWLAMSNSCYNPFIYGIYNEKFKREFNKRFSMCICKFQTTLDNQDRNVSVQTRASSIRSTYGNSSTRFRNNVFNPHTTHFNHSNFHQLPSSHHGTSLFRSGSVKNANKTTKLGYNVITFNDTRKLHRSGSLNSFKTPNGGGCGSIGIGGPGGVQQQPPPSVYQWRRNDFKPLHPNVIEDTDDEAILCPSIEAAITTTMTSPKDLITTSPNSQSTTITNSVHHINDDQTESCICADELGSPTECDGSCILNEVSRVKCGNEKYARTVYFDDTSTGTNNNNHQHHQEDMKNACLEMSEYSLIKNPNKISKTVIF
ncbi:neuropeptide Y receptor type 2 [Episyrphus balteatus]|uniref:neuropeptide Y receptor type 2 n=1 Tax=Episyrphus balteatus TaxID=286459 RepID=UPI00248528FA|nr:neuropeptide Y receptor type 2 [Episyrphus balteatus]XP_055841688.1 neuropeptide Y receptor type 2 [Episyrphus balteatus]